MGSTSLFPPDISFWQAGMATSFGPVIRFHGVGYFCAVNNVSQYDLSYTGSEPGGTVHGLPGGPAWCLPISLGINNEHAVATLEISPNPSTGLFRFPNLPSEKRILDARGREVVVTRESEVDLSNYPPGVYTAVVTTATGRQAVRLVVCSP